MAVRIAGVNIPDEKRIVIALTYIYGIGRAQSEQVLERLKIDAGTRANKLSADDINKLRAEIEKDLVLEGELKRQKMMNIKRLKEIGSYRGSRHSKGLPVRGQRTKTNTRTVRGNKRATAGSGRRLAEKK